MWKGVGSEPCGELAIRRLQVALLRRGILFRLSRRKNKRLCSSQLGRSVRNGDVPFICIKYLVVKYILVLMIKYLDKMDLVEINRKTLEIHNEINEFHLMMPEDLSFCINFVKNHIDDDIYNKALAYCVSIIVIHPFKNGNHRTSLYSAERFLILNGYKFIGNVESHKELQKWRIQYEQKHELEKRFAQITFDENAQHRISEITQIMTEKYGVNILNWLKKNYKSS
jgi:prophage maintenance system killer protein